MHAHSRAGLLGVLAIALSAPLPLRAQPAAARDALARIDAEGIRAHIGFLSSDLLEGRGVGTRGGAVAAEYIAGEFAQAGLRPAGPTWYQQVRLSGWEADVSRTRLTATRADRALQLDARDGVLLWPSAGVARAAVEGELLFVGYGTRAPEYGWNDYKGDVRGRIVLVLAGDPPAPPAAADIFEGDALTYYGRWSYKIEEAARQGAAAILLVHTSALAGYDWSVVQGGWGGEIFALREDTSAVLPALNGWVRDDAARRLLAHAGLDFAELFVRAARRDFEPVATGMMMRIEVAGTLRNLSTVNVAGMLPGGAPGRASETVIFTAHHDGLGIGQELEGDEIYNGAYDNAAGVALLLEIAEAFSALPRAPDRSVLFLATGAEEAGILGATYYTRHPLVPLEQTVGVINLEGANLWGETDDVSGVGAERSTLGPALQRAAGLLGMRATPERAPALGLFFRSDQFPFARRGVPALVIDHGLSYRERPVGWGVRVVGEFLQRSYHAPFDELPAGADLRGAVQQARIAFLLGYDLASRAERPIVYDDLPSLPPPPVRRTAASLDSGQTAPRTRP
jgi:Zn-dependent M28 family amino/carboxypeptidase